jgi:hypothetical protein
MMVWFSRLWRSSKGHSMSRISRNLLCIWVGNMVGGLGGLPVAIFWPLLFPLRLQGSSRGEDAGGIVFLALYVSFAVAGFLLCRKLTRKYVREEPDSSGHVLFR